jgi:O-antigen/teichoic acid export membrane protein
MVTNPVGYREHGSTRRRSAAVQCPPMRPPVGSVRSNFLFLVSGEAVNKLTRFAAALLFARALTPAEFGDLNVAIALSGILLVAVNFGLSDLGARDVALDPARAAVTAGRVLGLRLAALTVAGLPALALTLAVWSGREGLALLAYAMSAVMTVSADWIARGLAAMSRVAVATGVGGAVVAVGAGVLAVTGGSPTGAMAWFVTGELTTAVLLWVFVAGIGRPAITLGGVRSLLKRAAPVAVSSFVIYTYTANLDTIIIAATRSSREAGLYSAGYRVVIALSAIGTLAAYALLPRMAGEVRTGAGAEGVRRMLKGAMAPLATLGLAIMAVAVVAGGPILGFLFGSEFEPVGPTFVLLTAGLAWYITAYPAAYALLALGDNASYMRGALAAGLAGLALDLALIPPFGSIGAGAASATAFVLAAAVWTWRLGLLKGESLRRYLPSLGALAAGSLVAVLALIEESLRIPAFVIIGATALAMAAFAASDVRRLGLGRATGEDVRP